MGCDGGCTFEPVGKNELGVVLAYRWMGSNKNDRVSSSSATMRRDRTDLWKTFTDVKGGGRS
jgi:hypothetical protein